MNFEDIENRLEMSDEDAKAVFDALPKRLTQLELMALIHTMLDEVYKLDPQTRISVLMQLLTATKGANVQTYTDPDELRDSLDAFEEAERHTSH